MYIKTNNDTIWAILKNTEVALLAFLTGAALLAAKILAGLALGALGLAILAAIGIYYFHFTDSTTTTPKRPATKPKKKYILPNGDILEGPDKALGAGQFGTVEQYHLNERAIAIKMPAKKEYNELQKQELEILKKANEGNHRNIIKFLGSATIEGNIWIFTELMAGSVSNLLQRCGQQLSWATRLSIARQLTSGLAHLHRIASTFFTRKAIVHQDLKPDNLLTDGKDTPDIQVVISDFGLGREVDQLTLGPLGRINNPKEGSIGGTLLYAAPEVVDSVIGNGDSCNPKSDVFSTGMILWELATTKEPDRTQKEIINGDFYDFVNDEKKNPKITTQKTFIGFKTTISQPTYPQASHFGPIIKKCIQKAPGKRPDAEEVHKELNQLQIV